MGVAVVRYKVKPAQGDANQALVAPAATVAGSYRYWTAP
jgi:hypothetical protein